jgi:small conductance mechanosensitive channel
MDTVVNWLKDRDWAAVATGGVRIVVILVVLWILTRFLRTALTRLERLLIRKEEDALPSGAVKRAETIGRLLRQAVLIALWTLGILMILNQLGIEISPILAGLGVAGLAFGFGAQNLVRDVISGFFFLLENQVRIGDVAVVNGTGGLVEEINLRTVVLRDLAGVVHVFPNGAVTTLSNMTKDWSAHVFEVGVAYKEDTDRVVEVIKRTAADLKSDSYFSRFIIADAEIFGVDSLADSAVVIKGRIKTAPIKQWEVGREFRRRVKKAFDQEGIEIPFPHLSLYFGEASKPMEVLLKNSES